MIRAQMQAVWREIYEEIHQRLLDVRPKLKDYDAVIVIERVKKSVLDNYEQAKNAEELKGIAMKCFPDFRYRRGSKYNISN